MEMLPDDKPDDETIDNDAKFDKWYDDYATKMQREAAQRSMTKVGEGPVTFEDIPTFTGTGG